MKPAGVSIQNEPEFEADYDSCIFRPTEQGTHFTSYVITARVLSVQNMDPWSKAGVMIRASLSKARWQG